jgi:hypothetical protein
MTMTELVDLTDREVMIGFMTTDIVDQKELAEQLLREAQEQKIELVGPDGLLNLLTKNVLKTALDAGMSEHLGMRSTTQLAIGAVTAVMGLVPRRC